MITMRGFYIQLWAITLLLFGFILLSIRDSKVDPLYGILLVLLGAAVISSILATLLFKPPKDK